MCERVEGKIGALETPIGFMPAKGDLDLTGLAVSPTDLKELFRVDPSAWKAEADDLRDQLARVGGNRPGIGYSSAPPAASGAAPQQPAPTSFRDAIDREWSDM